MGVKQAGKVAVQTLETICYKSVPGFLLCFKYNIFSNIQHSYFVSANELIGVGESRHQASLL